MLGGIVGDIIGSVYEWDRIKTKEFPLFCKESKFTDDTILTCATAKVLLNGGSYAEAYADFAIRYPAGGYGGRFAQWMRAWERGPYNSLGNGSAMRVGPIGWVCREGSALLWEARKSAECTHNHPEGIRGAQAVAMAIHLARIGRSKEIIRDEMETFFGYDLSKSVDEIRPDYQFDETCAGTVPQAIQCFLESTDFEDAIRNAVSLGGDSDTLACITGSIAEAHHKGVPDDIATTALALLPQEFVNIIVRFREKHIAQTKWPTKKEMSKYHGDMIKREAEAEWNGDPCDVWREGASQ